MSQFRDLTQAQGNTSGAGSNAILATDKSVEQTRAGQPDTPDVPLTPKEEQVLGLLAEGKTNRQIASEIHLAEGTVKNYVSRIMDKLHAQSRTELAVRAVNRQR